MKNAPLAARREKTGAVPSKIFLTVALCIVMPAALTAFAVAVFLAGVPEGLAAVEAAVAVVFIISSIVTGLRQRARQDNAVPGVEPLFITITAAGAAGCVLSFFVLSLDAGARTVSGLADALVCLFAAVHYVVWARLTRLTPGAGLRYPRLAKLTEHFLLITAGAFLFAMSFPGFIFREGFGSLAFVSLVPIFFILGRSGWAASVVFGGIYGFLAHALFNFWLAAFNPLALTIVLTIRVFYYVILFLLLKLAGTAFPRWAFLLQTVIWVGYEYLSAQGFIAYAYGILGYSQYLCIPLLQAAAIAGVWGLSLLVVFPGVYLGNALRGGFRATLPFFRKTIAAPAAYAVVFLAALVYGIVSRTDTASLPKLRVACVQHNIDPWVGGDPAYEKSLRILMRLSEQAAEAKPDLVVWPETALVPSLRYHTKVRVDQERYNNVIRPFLEFMDTQKPGYIIGNNDLEPAGRDEFGQPVTRSYNAALLLSGRDILGVYRKTHLVPFTEHFPYKDILPGVYNWLTGEDTHFYTEGGREDADKVFNYKGVDFSVLICFEDTFEEIARRFAQHGADMFINLTNDAWSKTREAETQHLAIAVFRAVENRRSLVRCTTSGITSLVDPDGVVTHSIPPFEEAVMTADVPINRGGLPPAAFIGAWFGLGSVFASLAGLAAGAVLTFVKKRKRKSLY
ncbi:MAG: apolipoprotein N-acyltransferase [Spirochaetales bacterium]|nr:apolipoprotein N-acyltransferase [Spirochaetales bacterium]